MCRQIFGARDNTIIAAMVLPFLPLAIFAAFLTPGLIDIDAADRGKAEGLAHLEGEPGAQLLSHLVGIPFPRIGLHALEQRRPFLELPAPRAHHRRAGGQWDTPMKHTEQRPYADPEAAARKLVELAAMVEAVQDGRIYIEQINALFMIGLEGSGREFGAGLKYAIQRGWLSKHESGTYVKLVPPGEDLLTRK